MTIITQVYDKYENIESSGKFEDKFFNASVKVYPSGLIEVYRSEKIRVKGAGGGVRGRSARSEGQRALYQQQAAVRAGTSIRELILANKLCYLWTMTFADEIEDRDFAMDEMKKFIKRLRWRGYKLPYVAVMEIQEKRSENYGVDVIHFHLATSERVEIEDFRQAWGHGYVFVSEHSGEIFKVSSYISKYVRKGFDDARVRGRGKKRYLCSRGLERPKKSQLIMSDVELEHLKEIAKNIVEYEEGIWLQVEAVDMEGEEVIVNYYKNDFDEKYREFAVRVTEGCRYDSECHSEKEELEDEESY